MLVKIITDNKNGKKWEIYKTLDNKYSYKYYEYFKSIGWKFVTSDNNYTKDAIEWEFDIQIA